MHRLTFDLIQHTPIIHFQSEYRGATLRASEVKPKLDKFLLKCFKRDKISIPNNWLIPGQKDALSYKLSFGLAEGVEIIKYFPLSNIGKNDRGILQEYIDSGRPLEGSEVDRRLLKSKILSPTPFFANAEYAASRLKEEEARREEIETGVLRTEEQKKPVKGDVRIALLAKPKEDEKASIRGIILCKKESLCEKIKQYINDFFFQHNFGMRQSKGFGSFSIEDKEKIKEPTSEDNKLYFDIQVDSLDQLFERINLLYKSFRSGLNEYRGAPKSVLYTKPVIYFYATEKQASWWDKRSIKSVFVPHKQMQHDKNRCKDFLQHQNKKIDYRDMFGLSTNESWGKHYRDMEIKKSCFFGEGNNRRDVDRMKSPLQFKPILVSEHGAEQTYRIYIEIFDKEVGLSELIAKGAKVQVTNSQNSKKVPLSFLKGIRLRNTLDFKGYYDHLTRLAERVHHSEGKRILEILSMIYAQLKDKQDLWQKE